MTALQTSQYRFEIESDYLCPLDELLDWAIDNQEQVLEEMEENELDTVEDWAKWKIEQRKWDV